MQRRAAHIFLWLSLILLAVSICVFLVTLSPSYQSCIANYKQSNGDNREQGFVENTAQLIVCEASSLNINTGAITALATIAVAAFTLTLWLVTNNQVRLAREEFTATHRPRLRIRGIQKDRGGAFIEITNVGESPAIITGVRGVFGRKDGIRWATERPNLLANVKPLEKSQQILAAGESRGFCVSATEPGSSTDGYLVLAGVIQYADANKIKRATGFCWAYAPITDAFIHPKAANKEVYDYEYNYED